MMPTHCKSQKRKEEEVPPSPMAHPEKRTKTVDEALQDQCTNDMAHVTYLIHPIARDMNYTL